MSAAATDPFFQVAYTPRSTTEGEVQLPIAYYDTGQLMAVFGAEPELVREALGDVPLDLVTLGGKARIVLVFFEYRSTSIGPYNEVGLATPCVPRGQRLPLIGALDILRNPRKRRVGVHVLHLPVTTAAANAAGRELWGYPKFVTPIEVELGQREFSGRVQDPEDEASVIVELEGSLPAPIWMPPVDLMTLSCLDGQVLRTVVDVRGAHFGGSGGGLKLRIGDSAHPMAETLRRVGLDGVSADFAVFCRQAHSLLHLGERV